MDSNWGPFSLSVDYEILDLVEDESVDDSISSPLISDNNPLLSQSVLLDYNNEESRESTYFVEPSTSSSNTSSTSNASSGSNGSNNSFVAIRPIHRPEVRRGPGRPSLNRTTEQAVEATKETNKKAAKVYRVKKKEEQEQLELQIQSLEQKILSAKNQLEQLVNQINGILVKVDKWPQNSKNKFFRKYEKYKRSNPY